MQVYNIDIELAGEGFEIDTLYFNEDTKGLKEKTWTEKNIFLLFERMKNNYHEVLKFLRYHTKENTDENKNVGTINRKNRDFTVLIGEIENRIKDCDFYQENLTTNFTQEGFGAFVTNEFYRLEQENHMIQEINKTLISKE